MPVAVPTVAPPPPPYTVGRALLFGFGAGVPVLAALLFGEPRAALFAGMGAVLALQADPRRSIPIRIAAVVAALILIVGSGTLGVMLKDDKVAMTMAVIGISFLAGLPKPFFPYLTLVGKVCAAIVIVTSAGIAATGEAAAVFIAGGVFALLLAVLKSLWYHRDAPGLTPYAEMQALMAGERNPLFYAFTMATAVLLAMLLADALHAKLPGWVGLTVLFVMHPDDAVALKLMAQRLGGTLAGIALAGLVVHVVQDQWILAGLAIVMAALLPKATAMNYFWMSATFTALVMLLLDLALLKSGGDAPLLLWRLYDTMLGCGVAGAVLLAVYGSRRLRARRPHAGGKANDADGDPPDVPASDTGSEGVQG
jgi:hypothetical protein